MSLFKNHDKIKNYVDRAAAVKNIFYGELTTGDIDYFIERMYIKSEQGLQSETININDNKLCCVMNTNGSCIKSDIEYIGSGEIGNTFSVSSYDEKYVIKVISIDDVFMKKRNIMDKEIECICKFQKAKDYQYISCDKFTNEFMNGIIISYLMNNSKINFNPFIEYHGVYICGEYSNTTGYILQEFANHGNLEQLTDINADIIDGIMMQTIFGLDYLKKNNYFNHGDLKPSNILLINKQISGDYNGIKFSCPYTVKIADFDKSSITIKDKIRIYNYDLFSENLLISSPFKQNIKVSNYKKYYKFSTVSHRDKYSYIRHMGIPFYMSYDIYTFIVSFMLLPGVFDIIINNKILKTSYWDTLWIDNESKMRKIISKEANKKKVNISYDTVIDLIDDVKLKCDLVEDIISSIKESF